MVETYEVPTIAGVIATYNRPQSLKRLLDCLANQVHFDFDKLQVGIVDDGSDVPYDIDWSSYPFKTVYIYRERAGVDDEHPQGVPRVYSARNIAASKIEGEIIYMMDDEITFHPHTLFALQLYHTIQDNIVLLAHNSHAGAAHYYTCAFKIKTKGPAGWASSEGMSVPRKWWNEVGGFDEDFDGSMGFADRDLAMRLVNAGCEIWLGNGITTWADKSEGPGSWRDHFLREWHNLYPNREDRNAELLFRKHPGQVVEVCGEDYEWGAAEDWDPQRWWREE